MQPFVLMLALLYVLASSLGLAGPSPSPKSISSVFKRMDDSSRQMPHETFMTWKEYLPRNSKWEPGFTYFFTSSMDLALERRIIHQSVQSSDSVDDDRRAHNALLEKVEGLISHGRAHIYLIQVTVSERRPLIPLLGRRRVLARMHCWDMITQKDTTRRIREAYEQHYYWAEPGTRPPLVFKTRIKTPAGRQLERLIIDLSDDWMADKEGPIQLFDEQWNPYDYVYYLLSGITHAPAFQADHKILYELADKDPPAAAAEDDDGNVLG